MIRHSERSEESPTHLMQRVGDSSSSRNAGLLRKTRTETFQQSIIVSTATLKHFSSSVRHYRRRENNYAKPADLFLGDTDGNMRYGFIRKDGLDGSL